MTAWLPPEEVRAAAETHHELGLGYQDAVIESFLEKVGRQVDAEVEARLARPTAHREAIRQRGPARSPLTLPIVSLSLGIPFSAIAVGVGRHWPDALPMVAVVWIAVVIINIASARRG